MGLFDSFYNRFIVKGFLINSMPKAGTNLLAKAVSLFPGIHANRAHIIGDGNLLLRAKATIPRSGRGRAHLGYTTYSFFNQQASPGETQIQIGIDYPRPIPLGAMRKTLLKIKTGSYVTAHLPFSLSLSELLSKTEIRSLLILRDPRDVVVSHAKYISSNPNHFLYHFYQTLSESERIMYSIIGTKRRSDNVPILLNIYDRYQSILGWESYNLNYTTYFEKLVGPQGDGSYKDQVLELENIARHLQLKYSPQIIDRIANQLFGGTTTFRKGTIGRWRWYFTEEHKLVFSELAGDLLIDLGYEEDNNW